MEIAGKHVVVTGGGSGIGQAMVERFAKEQARGVVVVDRNGAAASKVADQVGGLAITADVSKEAEILRTIAAAEAAYGPIDLFCSNAGIAGPVGGAEVPNEGWQLQWNIHVMAHIWAARALLPGMLERGDGYLLSTASAAGLLMTPGAAPYTVTKHAALALAESFDVLYRDRGVRFSCLCPGLVETPMIAGVDDNPVGRAVRVAGGPAMQPAEVAEIVVEALREERFLIITHPERVEGVQTRAADPTAYLDAMRSLWSSVGGSP